ncbi:MAG: VWA domain-containing protein [Bacteroidales bacterium]|nr:VWA domain-containing protein [Bacteroidales bacterium]
MDSIFFEYPGLLYLEFLLIPMVGLYLFREIRRKNPSLTVSSAAPYRFRGNQLYKIFRHLPFVLRCIAVAAIIVAIARPRSSSTFEKIDSEGIDIVLAMDISTSMLARDFKPDRIGAAKDIAIQFIAERPSDRIGVVVFAGESFTQSPLTTDRPTLINLMKEVECGIIEDGTAIGNGLANAVARLKDSPAKSRVIILLTDGVNNRGEIAPQMAIEIAKTYGIRVYTIGVGAMGEAPYPMMTPYGVKEMMVKVEIDEELLKEIASETGGEYFRATDNTKLLEIYRQINEMEKSRTTVDSFPLYKEEFNRFALVALAALLLELVLRLFGARRIV